MHFKINLNINNIFESPLVTKILHLFINIYKIEGTEKC